jgi:uncharacterized membrane protein
MQLYVPYALFVACGICFLIAIIIVARNQHIEHTTNPYIAAVFFIAFGIALIVTGGQIAVWKVRLDHTQLELTSTRVQLTGRMRMGTLVLKQLIVNGEWSLPGHQRNHR